MLSLSNALVLPIISTSLAKHILLPFFLINNIIPDNQEPLSTLPIVQPNNLVNDASKQQVDIVASYNQGNFFLMSGQFDKALIEFNKIIKASPNNADFYISRGIIYEKLFDWDLAINDYRKANDIYKSTQLFHLNDDPVVLSNIGNALTGKLQWEEALKYFNNAAKLKPDYEAPLIGRALVQYQLGLKKESIAYFQLLSSRYPSFADGQAALAVMIYSNSNSNHDINNNNDILNDAKTHWETALEEDSRYLDIDWVENIRRWPPALVNDLKLFKTAIVASNT